VTFEPVMNKNRYQARFLRLIRAHGLYFLMILFGIIVCEVIFVTVSTGYFPTDIDVLIWKDMRFFLPYLLEEPLDTLKFILVNKPVLVIESRLDNPSQTVWGLHFYSYSLIAHFISALILTGLISPSASPQHERRYQAILGSGLLLVSSVYLYLSSCCTGGANWVIQTVWLAIITDPALSTEALISTYQENEGLFFWTQLVLAVVSFYLIFQWYRSRKSNINNRLN
jgi:hypothetical protein